MAPSDAARIHDLEEQVRSARSAAPVACARLSPRLSMQACSCSRTQIIPGSRADRGSGTLYRTCARRCGFEVLATGPRLA